MAASTQAVLDAEAEQTLLELFESEVDDPHRPQLRDRAIAAYLPLAKRTAKRFQLRGEELDDLTQVALIGLIKAVDRYDPARGVHFAHYVVPTMMGELKRHFRDRAWTIRVNRGLQELHLRIVKAVPELSQRLQRTPSTGDIAGYLAVPPGEVLEGMLCVGAYSTRSFSDPTPGDDDVELGDLLGDLDPRLERVPDRVALSEVVAQLSPREQQIIKLRFEDNLTQVEIGGRVGLSQMHVSRLLAKAFGRLRGMLLNAA